MTARNLTDEDWNSDLAKNVAILIVQGLVQGLLLGLVIGVVLVLVLLQGLGIGVVLVLVLWLVLALVLGVVMVLKDTKVFLFLGAYFHYRERMKKSETLRRG